MYARKAGHRRVPRICPPNVRAYRGFISYGVISFIGKIIVAQRVGSEF